jgi:hypothetical protein
MQAASSVVGRAQDTAIKINAGTIIEYQVGPVALIIRFQVVNLLVIFRL